MNQMEDFLEKEELKGRKTKPNRDFNEYND